MHNQVNFKLIIESTPQLLDLTQSSLRGFQKVLFTDSIFNFFPWVEVFIKDANGVIPDQINFLEGLSMIVKIGNETSGYMGGDYIWVKNEFHDVTVAECLSGTNAFIFGHKYIKFNKARNRSWYDTVKNVIDDIATKDYVLDSTKKFFSNTTGKDYWYQSFKRNSTWIQNIADAAFDNAHPKSPYYAFINSLGEFYFMHLYDLFTQQPINIGNPYKIEMREGTMTDPFSIQDYLLQYPGVETNFQNYKMKSYKISKAGVYENTTHEMKDHVYKDGTNKLTIRKDFIDTNGMFFLGCAETIADTYNYQGIINSLYRDSALAYRAAFTVPFNPKLVCGKVIETKVSSAYESKKMLKEFSGKWLVLNTLHFMDKDALPYTHIEVAKSTVFVDKAHPMYNDFIL